MTGTGCCGAPNMDGSARYATAAAVQFAGHENNGFKLEARSYTQGQWCIAETASCLQSRTIAHTRANQPEAWTQGDRPSCARPAGSRSHSATAEGRASQVRIDSHARVGALHAVPPYGGDVEGQGGQAPPCAPPAPAQLAQRACGCSATASTDTKIDVSTIDQVGPPSTAIGGRTAKLQQRASFTHWGIAIVIEQLSIPVRSMGGSALLDAAAPSPGTGTGYGWLGMALDAVECRDVVEGQGFSGLRLLGTPFGSHLEPI